MEQYGGAVVSLAHCCLTAGSLCVCSPFFFPFSRKKWKKGKKKEIKTVNFDWSSDFVCLCVSVPCSNVDSLVSSSWTQQEPLNNGDIMGCFLLLPPEVLYEDLQYLSVSALALACVAALLMLTMWLLDKLYGRIVAWKRSKRMTGEDTRTQQQQQQHKTQQIKWNYNQVINDF